MAVLKKVSTNIGNVYYQFLIEIKMSTRNRKMLQQIKIKGRSEAQIIQESFLFIMKKGRKEDKHVYPINSDIAAKATRAVFFHKISGSNTSIQRCLTDTEDCGSCNASLLLSSHCVMCECGHMFHYTCIRSWWDQVASCAVCFDTAGFWIPIDRKMTVYASKLPKAERGNLMWNRKFLK